MPTLQTSKIYPLASIGHKLNHGEESPLPTRCPDLTDQRKTLPGLGIGCLVDVLRVLFMNRQENDRGISHLHNHVKSCR